MNYFQEAVETMTTQLGHDVVVSLATIAGDKPNVRAVNAYFKQDAFFVTTYGLSHKMREIAENPSVALCRDLFVAHGTGSNLGSPVSEKNVALAAELRRVFCAFYDRHVNEKDPHTCILKVELADAVVFTDRNKYIVDFIARSAEKQDFVNDIVL